MYIMAQYPQFLKAHWKLIKIIVNKSFESMHEAHPGTSNIYFHLFVDILIVSYYSIFVDAKVVILFCY